MNGVVGGYVGECVVNFWMWRYSGVEMIRSHWGHGCGWARRRKYIVELIHLNDDVTLIQELILPDKTEVLQPWVYTHSSIDQKYWHECQHCPCGNDVFKTLNSMGIMDKFSRAEILASVLILQMKTNWINYLKTLPESFFYYFLPWQPHHNWR